MNPRILESLNLLVYTLTFLTSHVKAEPVKKEININQELVTAIKNHDLKKVINSIEKGADVNFSFENASKQKLTPMALSLNNFSIAKNDDYQKIIDELIKVGADIEAQDENGNNYLLLLVAKNNLPAMTKLLQIQESSKLINQKNIKGETALYLALNIFSESINNYNESLVKKDQKQVDFYNNLQNAYQKIIDALIKAGADLETQDQNGNNYLLLLVAKNDLPAVTKLLQMQGSNKLIDQKNKIGETVLHLAMQPDKKDKKINKNLVTLLLEKGSYVDAKDNKNKTPLHYAVEKNDEDIVNLLMIKYEANGNVKDNESQTPLVIAIKKNLTPIALNLLKFGGIDKEAIDKDGKTPLHIAIENGNDTVFTKLISDKVNVNAKDKNGKTPLHYAAEQRSILMIQILLQNGADVNAKDNNNLTAIEIAAKKNNKDAVKLLAQKGSNIELIKNYQDMYDIAKKAKL